LGNRRDLHLFEWPVLRDQVKHQHLSVYSASPDSVIEFCDRRLVGAYFFDNNYELYTSSDYYDAWMWFEYLEDELVFILWRGPAK